MTKAAIQLYTLRASDNTLPEIIHQVADAGFHGVEFAHRVREEDPTDIRDALRSRGVIPVAAHVQLSQLEDRWDELSTLYDYLDCRQIVIPHLSAAHVHTTDRIEQLAERLSRVEKRLTAEGFELVIHNTREMMLPQYNFVGIRQMLRAGLVPPVGWNHLSSIFAALKPIDETEIDTKTGFGKVMNHPSLNSLRIQFDTQHIASAGYDSPRVFDVFADRIHSIHIADTIRDRRFPVRYESVTPNEGIVDLPAAMDAGMNQGIEWMIYEHDHPDDNQAILQDAVRTMKPLLRAET